MSNSKTIQYKATGQNVKVIIDGQTYNRRVVNAEERKSIKEAVASYNTKPLVKEKKAIIKIMTADKVEVKKSKSAEAKRIARKPTKAVETLIEEAPVLSMEEQIEAAKKLLEENNYSVNAKKAPSTRTYRGEY